MRLDRTFPPDLTLSALEERPVIGRRERVFRKWVRVFGLKIFAFLKTPIAIKIRAAI